MLPMQICLQFVFSKFPNFSVTLFKNFIIFQHFLRNYFKIVIKIASVQSFPLIPLKPHKAVALSWVNKGSSLAQSLAQYLCFSTPQSPYNFFNTVFKNFIYYPPTRSPTLLFKTFLE